MRDSCFLYFFVFVLFGSGCQRAFQDKAETLVETLVETNNFSGVILVQQEGRTKLYEAYGLADRTSEVPHTTESVFQITAVSRLLTACAILVLEERDYLSLEDPVSKYIPGLRQGDEITIHHLLTQSSGIPDIRGMASYKRLEQNEQTPATLVRHVKDKAPEFAPGTRYANSSSNYCILANILEKVSGKTYGQFLRDAFLLPMDLEDTGHPDEAGSQQAEVVPGYQPAGVSDLTPAPEIRWTARTGDGSIYSNAADLMKFTNAFFNGQLVNKTTMRRALTAHAGNAGYGWYIRQRQGKTQYYVNGKGPGYSSAISHFPDQNLTVIILSNIEVPLPLQMANELSAMLLGEPYQYILSRSGKTGSEIAKEVVGKYKFGPDFYQPNRTVTVAYDGQYLTCDFGVLLHRTGKQFFNRNYWADVAFDLDQSGSMVMQYYGRKGKRIK